MMRNTSLIFALLLLSKSFFACTNLIVTKGASADSATYLVYLNDGEWLYHLDITPAQDHQLDDSLTITSMSGIDYKIHQVPHTNAVIGFLMNEHQLAVGESTFVGREELWDKTLPLKYWELMYLALQRAKTAREAIEVITSLVDMYGYGSEGESISIADPNEAWLLEMIGTGGKGSAAWVAIKIPDGTITAHANHSRIGTFPLNDPDKCLYSENVVSLAVEKGFYSPESGEPFRFNQAYDPANPQHLKYSESRVWSIFRRVAPSMKLSSDYHRNLTDERYPLYIKPDEKLSTLDVFSLVRDHYEGTNFDMTKGIAAGPFGNPNRPRPLDWQNDSAKYTFERPVSTYNTAFSYVAQLRNYLPNEIGGVAWYGVDDTYTSCYFPIYCQATSIPEPFAIGDINHYSSESAWWAFNFAANYANIRYMDIVKDIQSVQRKIEKQFVKKQASIERATLDMEKEQRIKFLNTYTNDAGLMIHKQWVNLGNQLVTKYNDGYVKDSAFRINSIGYPEEWLKIITNDAPEKYKVPEK